MKSLPRWCASDKMEGTTKRTFLTTEFILGEAVQYHKCVISIDIKSTVVCITMHHQQLSPSIIILCQYLALPWAEWPCPAGRSSKDVQFPSQNGNGVYVTLVFQSLCSFQYSSCKPCSEPQRRLSLMVAKSTGEDTYTFFKGTTCPSWF